MVSTDYKRLFLRGLMWDAEDNSDSLADTLKAAARAKLTSTSGGSKVLVGTSGNGQTVTYTLPANGDGITPAALAELCEEMFRRYDEAVENLGGTPNDEDIFNEMMALLNPTHERYSDFTFMRNHAA